MRIEIAVREYTNKFKYIDTFRGLDILTMSVQSKDYREERRRTGMNSEFALHLPEEWEGFSRFFFALGDKTRQQILLMFEPGEEICVNDIARVFHLSRPAISHHLKVLRDAALLVCEKRGKEVFYRVNYLYCVEVLRVVHSFVARRAEGGDIKELLAGDISSD
jgi:DNA-binding transcriptional ArsR family regulator